MSAYVFIDALRHRISQDSGPNSPSPTWPETSKRSLMRMSANRASTPLMRSQRRGTPTRRVPRSRCNTSSRDRVSPRTPSWYGGEWETAFLGSMGRATSRNLALSVLTSRVW
jgi:hypothetical protein